MMLEFLALSLARMSLADEHVQPLNFDNVQTFDAEHKALYVNSIDASTGLHVPSTVTTTAHIMPATQQGQHTHSITASVPHLTTTINMPPNVLDKSKSALEVRQT